MQKSSCENARKTVLLLLLTAVFVMRESSGVSRDVLSDRVRYENHARFVASLTGSRTSPSTGPAAARRCSRQTDSATQTQQRPVILKHHCQWESES